MRKWIVMFLAFLCFTLGFSTVWASQVVDESDVLTAEQETELNNSLSEFTSWSRQEMDILILPSIPRGESIKQYSERYVRSASENLDGGIVLVIAMEDRKYYIAETGGMYQRVPLQGEAMDNIVASTESALHSGDYFGALDGFQKKVSEAVKAAPAATSSRETPEVPMGKKISVASSSCSLCDGFHHGMFRPFHTEKPDEQHIEKGRCPGLCKTRLIPSDRTAG